MMMNLRRESWYTRWAARTAMIAGGSFLIAGILMAFGWPGLWILGGSVLFVVGWVEMDS